MLKKIIATAIYIMGICCVLYFGIRGILGGDQIPPSGNPNPMLEFTEFESSVFMLAIVCVPMLASCLLMIRAYGIKNKAKIICILVPGLITAIPFIFVAGFMLLLMGRAMLDIMGLR